MLSDPPSTFYKEVLEKKVMATPAGRGLEKIVIGPVQKHEKTFVFLHGFQMEALDLLDLFLAVRDACPGWRFVLPVAPEMAITAHEKEVSRSWFDYLTDTEGVSEDTVDLFSMRCVRTELLHLLRMEASILPTKDVKSIYLGGLSQGGCMALDIASRVDLAGVITLVAPRLSVSMSRPLTCPWYSLISEDDEVFPLSWSAPLFEGARKKVYVKETHWATQETQELFLKRILEDVGEESR